MAEKYEGDIPENNKNQKSFSKPDEPFKNWYDRVYGKERGDKDKTKNIEENQEEEESKKGKKFTKEDEGQRDYYRESIKIISTLQTPKELQDALNLVKEEYLKREMTEKQYQNLKIFIEKKLAQSEKEKLLKTTELDKINKKIEKMDKNYAKRFGGFMPSKEWQEAPPAGIPIPPGFEAKMNMTTRKSEVKWNDPYEGMPAKEKEGIGKLLNEKQRLEEELRLKRDLKEEKVKEASKKKFSEGKKAENESPKSEQGPTYQEIIQEIRKAEGKKLFPKNKTEKEEAERQLESLEKKRKEYQQIAQGMGIYKEVDKRIKNIREMSSKGKMFFANLNEETRASFELDGIPPELQGLAQEYYHQEVLKIIGEKLAPEKREEQEKILREYLKVLRTGRLAPELITSNPLWIEMTSLVPYFHPEVQKEFKARFEIFRYTLGFKIANGVESGIAGASGVLLPHIGKTLKVPEIQKAYDLLEERSQITEEDIKKKYDIKYKDDKDDEAKRRVKELLGKENPLYAGTEVQKKELFVNLALKLAEAFGEKIEGLNNKEKEDLAEKYMWAIEEAEDVWRITFRSDENDIGMEGRGGQWWLNRLFHYPARLKTKGFGYESTRKYFNKPFLPIWVEGEPILPVLKGEKLEISGADINMLRGKFKAKGLKEDEIEKRIRMIKGKLLEGRGLMMKGLWAYQIDHLKIAGLLRLKFGKDGEVKITKDGNGRELPYLTYKRKFTSPSGKEKEMVVRVSVFEKNKDAVRDEDRYGYGTVIDIENPSAEILSEICQQVPEGFYGSYVGDWIIKADNTKKLLEGGVLKFPPGSQDDMRRLLAELQSKNLFDYLDPLSKDRERKPGKYYQEDAWEDLLRGAVDFGLHEGKKMFEPWKMWGAWRAGVLTKAATDFKVITNEQGREIENEMLPFLGMRGNIPRWLRCNFDRYTMVYRWGPMRMMMLGEMIKQFFQAIFPELPSASRKK